ncbi:hypothetical protein KBC79_01460 [Candidatus Woesebacteria bacterium]|nr:hypothetical protein [Candidatus Woesebacteria bacterium]
MRYVFEGQWSQPEFEYLANNEWVWTEKVDGTNIRVMWSGAGLSFGGKTDDAQMYVPLMTRLQELFDTTPKRQMFKELFNKPDADGDIAEPQVCLYGEGYGAKIQKGGGNYRPDGVDFVLFDVKIGDWWLQRKDVEGIAQKLGIKVVPIVGRGTLIEAVEMVKRGFNSQWGDFASEGLVCRPSTELKTRNGDRVITKIKCRDFKKD